MSFRGGGGRGGGRGGGFNRGGGGRGGGGGYGGGYGGGRGGGGGFGRGGGRGGFNRQDYGPPEYVVGKLIKSQTSNVEKMLLKLTLVPVSYLIMSNKVTILP